MKLQIWKDDLVELFDISRQNVMDVTRVLKRDKVFLKSQREDCMSLPISGADKVFASKLKTKRTKKDKTESYKNKH